MERPLEKLVSEDSPHYSIICFHYYIQYHLHVQLSEAAEYARKKGVVLKGDLPIGVDRNSVDTWVYPNLFRMNTSTGAPPDYFDKNGQNWGFPTYNWEEMSKDNYGWWRGRLTQMAKYFTAYRIDHILGFFRIWELLIKMMKYIKKRKMYDMKNNCGRTNDNFWAVDLA
ncbi:4-alpha-glucanotransferase DPE2 [Beta vulgaris subsp. vulgaris]|uniref:4-alpha-glucanotransferase DPE2 n=1 Tax=Beta vulgaris subsp. vulgaris TaxID=3555 RepID=UPI0025499715|nr:4-alpha-glucanotransferase DPE2 [Beta vulgaris subsp. vulgaris]